MFWWAELKSKEEEEKEGEERGVGAGRAADGPVNGQWACRRLWRGAVEGNLPTGKRGKKLKEEGEGRRKLGQKEKGTGRRFFCGGRGCCNGHVLMVTPVGGWCWTAGAPVGGWRGYGLLEMEGDGRQFLLVLAETEDASGGFYRSYWMRMEETERRRRDWQKIREKEKLGKEEEGGRESSKEEGGD